MFEKQIKEIQKLLTEKKLDPGPIDGELGPKTLAAIKACLTTSIKDSVTAKAIPIVEKAKEVIAVVAPPPKVTVDSNALRGRERPLFAKKLLMELGWKDYQAVALVGNFMQESYSDLRTNVWGDKKTAFGIAQWRDNYDRKTGAHSPGRLTDLMIFSKNIGKPIDDLEAQVRFVNWELTTGSEKGTGKLLKATKDINEALEVAIGYERPAGWKRDNPRGGHGWANREAFAKSIL